MLALASSSWAVIRERSAAISTQAMPASCVEKSASDRCRWLFTLVVSGGRGGATLAQPARESANSVRSGTALVGEGNRTTASIQLAPSKSANTYGAVTHQ